MGLIITSNFTRVSRLHPRRRLPQHTSSGHCSNIHRLVESSAQYALQPSCPDSFLLSNLCGSSLHAIILSDFTQSHLVGTRRASVKSSFHSADSRISPKSTPEKFSLWPQIHCGRTADLTTKHHGSAPLLDEEKGKGKIKDGNGKPNK